MNSKARILRDEIFIYLSMIMSVSSILIHYVHCTNTIFLLFYPYIDEFILDTVVNTNDIVSDTDASDSLAHARPFGESSYSAVMSKGTTIGMHNAYIAMGTFASAIFIVAIVVSFTAIKHSVCTFRISI